MTSLRLQAAAAAVMIFAAGCAKQPPAPPPAPPAPRQNIFALLPDPNGNTRIVVSNTGGAQEVAEPDHAVRVERADTAPTAPFPIDQPTVRRLFGAALDALPDPELPFVLHFDGDSDVLNAEAQAALPAILRAIQDRRSTDISVTGHTDTMGTQAFNYDLGMRRARRVADVLRAQGVAESSMLIVSHGESDQVVKTARGVAERLNRRVEVIVH